MKESLDEPLHNVFTTYKGENEEGVVKRSEIFITESTTETSDKLEGERVDSTSLGSTPSSESVRNPKTQR